MYNSCKILAYFKENNTLKCENFDGEIGNSYLDKLIFLLKRFSIKNELKTDLSEWENIINFSITEISPNNTKSGWGIYKGALKKAINLTAISDDKKEQLAEKLTKSSGGKSRTIKNTSPTSSNSKKETVITPEDIYLLRLFASTEIDLLSVDWLEFAILTSLRPNEILDCHLKYDVDHGYTLVAKNTAKSQATQDKMAAGEIGIYREIPLDHLSKLEINFIQSFLKKMLIKINLDGYTSIFQSARKALYKTSNNALNKSIAISVGRTQFAANAKASGMAKEDLAERMGHTDPTRATRSYGREASGF